MDRSLSPSPSPPPHPATEARAGHDTSKDQRSAPSSYRLFPIVDPTPPGTPVIAQRPSSRLASGKTSRRQSSSDTRERPSKRSRASGSANVSTAGKPSPWELDPLLVSQRSDQAVSSTPHLPHLSRMDMDTQSRDATVHGRSSSNLHDFADPPRLQPPSDSNDIVATQLHKHKPRSKPNLRIAVTKSGTNRGPPSPPPKSPRHRKADSERMQPTSLDRQTQPSVSPASPQAPPSVVPPSVGPPVTPSHMHSSVAQPSPSLTGGPIFDGLTLSTPSKPRQTVRNWLPTMHANFSTDSFATSRKAPSSKFSIAILGSRPNTSNGPALIGGQGFDMLPSKRSLASLRPELDSQSKKQSGAPPSATPHSPSPCLSTSRDVHEAHARPSVASDVDRKYPATMTFPNSGSPPQEESIADVIRHHLSNQARSSVRTDSSSESATRLRASVGSDKTDGSAKPPINVALAAARANVAALRNSDVSTASSNYSDRSKTSTSGISTRDRAFSSTSDTLSQPRSSADFTEQVDTLRIISQQCEALYARYSSLRAERQNISNGIIEKLKAWKPDPEYSNTLLDDQISLAAVTSTMDICFAKLKSLECRKEDAISALTTKLTHAQQRLASSRAPSMASSAEFGGRFLRTGRSTPDLWDGQSTNRSTRSSFPRIVSYTSEGDDSEYRLASHSRKASLGSELGHRLEAVQRQAPETILEVSETPIARRRSLSWDRSLSSKHDSATDSKPDMDLLKSQIDRDGQESCAASDDQEPKKVRVDGSKATEFLGLIAKSSNGTESPLIKMPDELSEGGAKSGQEAEVEIELLPKSCLRPAGPKAPLPLLTTSSLEPSGSTEPAPGSANPVSPAIPDLDSQLESFPVPGRVPSGPHAPPAIPSKSPDRERQCPESRHDSSMTVTATEVSKKPTPTPTPTIQVYLEQDEIMQLYRSARRAFL